MKLSGIKFYHPQNPGQILAETGPMEVTVEEFIQLISRGLEQILKIAVSSGMTLPFPLTQNKDKDQSS